MTERVPACSQTLVIPIASSPHRTDERPPSHAESTTVSGTEEIRSMSYPKRAPSTSSRPSVAPIIGWLSATSRGCSEVPPHPLPTNVTVPAGIVVSLW